MSRYSKVTNDRLGRAKTGDTIDGLSNDTFDVQAANSGNTTLQVIAASNGISLDATTGIATLTATDAGLYFQGSVM